MKLKTFLAAITLLLFCFVNGQAQVTVIKAGKLVDPATATTLTNQVILVEGGKIKAVGAGLQTPSGATIVDLSKSTMMPGLFNTYTHLCAKATIEADRLGIEFLRLATFSALNLKQCMKLTRQNYGVKLRSILLLMKKQNQNSIFEPKRQANKSAMKEAVKHKVYLSRQS